MRRGLYGLPVATLATAALGAASAATEMSFTDLEGRPFALASLRGQVVVLNFWATWCGPCVEEMPELDAVQERWGDRGVQVLGASADDPDRAASVRRFAKAHDISFPLVLGATTRQMESVGLPPTLPGTVLLDAEGKVVRRYGGVIDRAELERALQAILDGTPETEEPHGSEAADEPPAHEHAHDHGDASRASLVPS